MIDIRFPKRHLPKTLLWLVRSFQSLERKFVEHNVGHELAFDNSYIKRDLDMIVRLVSQTIVEHFQQMRESESIR